MCLFQSVSAEAIRLLLCVLGFLSFGYGSREFEVTADRLGCYRPEVSSALTRRRPDHGTDDMPHRITSTIQRTTPTMRMPADMTAA